MSIIKYVIKSIISVLAFSFFCSFANAQTSNFTEFSFGGNIEFKAPTLMLAASGFELSGLGSQNIFASVSADYGIEVSKSLVLLVGGKYDLQNTSVVKITGEGLAVAIEEKGHYSLFLAPGLALSDKTLGFAKLSYENAKYDVTGSVATGSAAGSVASNAQSVSGTGYGLGVRTHLGGNTNLDVEVGRIVYQNNGGNNFTVSSATTYGRVGISFRFQIR